MSEAMDCIVYSDIRDVSGGSDNQMAIGEIASYLADSEKIASYLANYPLISTGKSHTVERPMKQHLAIYLSIYLAKRATTTTTTVPRAPLEVKGWLPCL